MIGIFVVLMCATFVLHNFSRFTQCGSTCTLMSHLFIGPLFLCITLTFAYLMYLMKYKHNYEYKKNFKAMCLFFSLLVVFFALIFITLIVS